MQSRAFLHAKMTNQSSLGEEVCWQLNRASKTCPDHGGADTSVESAEAFSAIYRVETMPGATILVLGSNGTEGREAL